MIGDILFLPGSRDWHREPRGWRDVLLCRLGRHRRIMRALTGRVGAMCRCSCGATEFNYDGVWIAAERIGRRK